MHDAKQDSELEQALTEFAQDYAKAVGGLLLRRVRIASSLGNGFQVSRTKPYILVGNRTDPDHICSVLKRATEAALEIDCPGGQYLLHNGKEMLVF